MDLRQKRTALLVQAHDGSLYSSRELRRFSSLHRLQQVLDQINSSPSSPHLLFHYSHAAYSWCFIPQASSGTGLIPSIPFTKTAENYLLVGLERLSIQIRKCQSPEGRERDLTLWCQQAGTSSAVSWIHIASLTAGTVRANHPLTSEDTSTDKKGMREIRKNNICRKVICLLSHNHSMRDLSTKNPHTTVPEQSYYPYPQIYFNFFWEYYFSCTQPPFLFKIANSWSAGVSPNMLAMP